jgi:hypothetical protein
MKRGQSEVKRSHWLSRGKPGNLPKEGEAWVVEKRLTTGKVQPSPSADTASKYEAGRRRTHVAYPRITVSSQKPESFADNLHCKRDFVKCTPSTVICLDQTI